MENQTVAGAVQCIKPNEVTDQQAYEMAIAYAQSAENRDRIDAKYRKAFGDNKHKRTRKQWLNLVRVYGMKCVCELERMTEEEVNHRCLTLSQRFSKAKK